FCKSRGGTSSTRFSSLCSAHPTPPRDTGADGSGNASRSASRRKSTSRSNMPRPVVTGGGGPTFSPRLAKNASKSSSESPPGPGDATVALLDADEAPRDVDMHQVVALLVQVDALAGDITGDQHPDWGGLPLELLDHAHLLAVRQPAMEHGDRRVGKPQSPGQ